MVTVFGFHNTPESQNSAVIKDFTKFIKSLLIAPKNDAKNHHKLNSKNANIMYIGNCNK